MKGVVVLIDCHTPALQPAAVKPKRNNFNGGWNPGALQRSPKSACPPPPKNRKSPRGGGRIR